jgi:hypothetical protein
MKSLMTESSRRQEPGRILENEADAAAASPATAKGITGKKSAEEKT